MYTLHNPPAISFGVLQAPSSRPSSLYLHQLLYSKSKTFFLAIFHFCMMLIPFVFLMMHLGVERFKLHSYASIAINVLGALTFFAFFVTMKVFLFNEDKGIVSWLSSQLNDSDPKQEKKFLRLGVASNLLCFFAVSLIAGLGMVQCAYTINNGIFSSNANTIILSTIAPIVFLLLLINLIIRIQISSTIFTLHKKYCDYKTKMFEEHSLQSMTEHQVSSPEADEKSDDKKTIFDLGFKHTEVVLCINKMLDHEECTFESGQKQDSAPQTLIQDQELVYNTSNFATEI